MTFEEWYSDFLHYEGEPTKDIAKQAWDAATESNVWQRALDNELVLWGMLTTKEATFEEAQDKIRALLNITQSVATDPSVNGGYVLVPVEPTEAMINAWWDTHVDGETLDEVKAYKAMIQAAQEEE